MPVNPNWPVESWAALFSSDPNTTNVNTTWSGLSDRVLGFRCSYGGQYELGAIEAGDCEIACLNEDEALNPANPASPFNSGANRLLPYRRVMGTATWPSTDASGNLLNAANAVQWGQSTDTSTFEGGGLGEWIVAGSTPPTIVSSTTRAQAGTRSMRITWPTAANGGTNAVSLAWAPSQGPFKIGQQYTLSLYLWANAGTPRMRVQFGGTPVIGPVFNGTWQRVTVTWTADTVWSAFQIYPDTNTAGQQVWVDSVQVDLGPAASAYSTTGPVIYPLHAGYIERYPIAWDAQGYLGKANLTSVDSNALLARATLRDCLSEDVSQDTPRVTYRLDDPAGTTKAALADWSSASRGVAELVTFGAGKSRPTFGFDASPSRDAAPLTCVDFNPDSAANFITLLLSWTTTLSAPSTGSVEFWFRRPDGAPAVAETILMAFAPNSTHPLEIGVDTLGRVFAREINDGSTPTYYYTITDPSATCNNDWHHVVWTQAGTTSRATTLYVDGTVAGTATATHGGSVLKPYALFVGGANGSGGSTSPYAGQLSWLSVYQGSLSATRVADHWRSAARAHDRDLPGTRLQRALAWTGWQGPLAVSDTGQTVMGPATGYEGRTVADVARDCGIADAGYTLCHPDGDLTFVSRQAFYSQTTPVVVFGDGPGEAPYQGDIAFDLDPQYVYNAVEVTGAGGITSGVAEDLVSQVTYFRSSLSLSTEAARESDVTAYRDDLLYRYKDAHLRVAEITINPAANPSLWPVALGTKFGDRVTVTRRTPVFTMTGDYFVLNRSHETGPGKWLTKFQLVPVRDMQPWIVGDASYGQVGSTNVVAY